MDSKYERKPYALDSLHLGKIQANKRGSFGVFFLENQNSTRVYCQVDRDLRKLWSRGYKTIKHARKLREPSGPRVKDYVLFHTVAVSSILDTITLCRNTGKTNEIVD